MLVPATLAALPSSRAIPDRDVFYVAHPILSIREQAATLRRSYKKEKRDDGIRDSRIRTGKEKSGNTQAGQAGL